MNNIKSVYFLGIGGIGMSNLARYFLSKGKKVAGYDRTETELTKTLTSAGALIHYTDNINLIPDFNRDRNSTLVIYTPAIPADSREMQYFRDNRYIIKKRAEVLGEITKSGKALCCAGTHGKTTTSSMLAHILKQSTSGVNAFLGGILKNYNTNLLLDENSDFIVVEADEYDRSFHWLQPYMALITSVDPDHLDIYGTENEYLESFRKFTSLIRPNGALVIKNNTKLISQTDKSVRVYTYSIGEGDFHAENIRIGNGEIHFDFITPQESIKNIQLGVPIKINIENAIGAMAIAWLNGIGETVLRKAILSFKGAERRFDFILKTDDIVFIDDYAHHPEELAASIQSVKELYPDKKITGVFQPHLYSRTKDFAEEFAKSLSLLDELILLDIYPAREKPIEGITSNIIFEKVTCEKLQCSKNELINIIDNKKELQVLLTLGAGDIDQLLPGIEKLLKNKYGINYCK